MSQLPNDQHEYNRKLIAEFRENGRRLEERPLLLLTATGRRSGIRRTTPMMYVRLDDRLLVIASNAGAPKHPAWYHNLVADPAVTVEVDGDEYAATARPTTGADRDALFARISEQYPFFVDHQKGVSRTIPVVELIKSGR
ncbi:nitroreductase family deazaflavin-dependent oxidoreductase [Dactylosporangium fulvum]|uniref:Nitroreductase family deazaflavin-dependent oxidoreductase n=1 Tax=Dactylosporangium fulvum TaxID=53359 RepID=A0ABY5VTB8_9ACTN|nr:nitroreductase family deazaflavin-dependent oxidoreductase [Dactylosporangium fulvum]UWP80973.1 nitroreductase family deazaflavin-dependent oxidoreductase [Dactylosporangium fulvum]